MREEETITWKTVNGETSGTIIRDGGSRGYLVKLGNGKQVIVNPNYIPKKRK